MDMTPNLSLPFILPAQAQKHVTHNEAINALDIIVQLGVQAMDQLAPPADPDAGEAYIVAVNASGLWTGQDSKIAAFQDGVWVFHTPKPGWRAWVVATRQLVIWDGSVWSLFSGDGGGSNSISFLGINATADETNRLVTASETSLFTHAGAGHQIKVNKSDGADTASLLFQTGFTGHAEMGLTGSNNFEIKVSANGVAFDTALTVQQTNGRVGIGTLSPSARLVVEENGVNVLRVQNRQSFAGGMAGLIFSTGFNDGVANRNYAGVYGGDDGGTGAGRLVFRTRTNGTLTDKMVIKASGGVKIGSPAGGDKGPGTLSAQGVFDDNMLLSCYVFDQYLDGDINTGKWDACVPDRPIASAGTESGTVASREHEPMRKFRARIGTEHDPLSLDGYARHWREKRHLSALPNETSFDPETGLPTGAWVQRLVETAETQAILIETLNQRLKLCEHQLGMS